MDRLRGKGLRVARPWMEYQRDWLLDTSPLYAKANKDEETFLCGETWLDPVALDWFPTEGDGLAFFSSQVDFGGSRVNASRSVPHHGLMRGKSSASEKSLETRIVLVRLDGDTSRAPLRGVIGRRAIGPRRASGEREKEVRLYEGTKACIEL